MRIGASPRPKQDLKTHKNSQVCGLRLPCRHARAHAQMHARKRNKALSRSQAQIHARECKCTFAGANTRTQSQMHARKKKRGGSTLAGENARRQAQMHARTPDDVSPALSGKPSRRAKGAPTAKRVMPLFSFSVLWLSLPLTMRLFISAFVGQRPLTHLYLLLFFLLLFLLSFAFFSFLFT